MNEYISPRRRRNANIAFVVTLLILLVFLIGTFPASAKTIDPVPHMQQQAAPKKDEPQWFDPDHEQIIMDPHAIPAMEDPIPLEWSLRRKDPRAWA